MIFDGNYFNIIYNECDKEYLSDFIKYLDNEKERILNFFGIDKLNKKLIIKLYDSIEKYAEYRNYKLYEWSVGNMDVDDNNYYIHMLSYNELIKRKGHENKKIDDYYRLLIHEFIHVCHENYGTCHKVLRWIKEGLAIFLSEQRYNEGLINCDLDNLIKNGGSLYQNYYTLIKYCFESYGEDFIKKLAFDPQFGIEQTKIIYDKLNKKTNNR